MTAYLAILKDSFREAIASRILLIVLICILLLLIVLAGFSARVDRPTRLDARNVQQVDRVLSAINESAVESTPGGHTWACLDESGKAAIRELAETADDEEPENEWEARQRKRERREEAAKALDSAIGNPDLYKPAVFESINTRKSTQEVIEAAAIDDSSIRYRNMLLLSDAFPRAIRFEQTDAITLRYFGWELMDSFQMGEEQWQFLVGAIVNQVFAVCLGFFGVFASLLVTAGLIPRTFEAGEIPLLLSKPIRRSGLFVTKFFGGCVFTTLYSVLLVGGIWLLLGVRMNVWRPELLWGIPVYIFLFAIYFSVSAVAGVIWRNAIVSVVLVVVFWAGCFATGIAGEGLKSFFETTQLKEVTSAGKEIVATDGAGLIRRWNSGKSDWEQMPTTEVRMMGPFGTPAFSNFRYKPVYDPAADRVLNLKYSPFGNQPPEVMAGDAASGWTMEKQGAPPEFVSRIFVHEGEVLMPGTTGLHRFNGQSEKKRKQEEFLRKMTGGMLSTGSKAFETVSSGEYPGLSELFVSAMTADGDLFCLDEGRLHRIGRDADGSYSFDRTVDFDTEESGLIAACGNTILVAFGDGSVKLLDGETLEPAYEGEIKDGTLPRVAEASPGGSWFALLDHSHNVYVYDAKARKALDWTVNESGDASAIAFDEQDRLLVCDGGKGVISYDVGQQSQSDTWVESPGMLYWAYYGAIRPLYAVLPKPSKLDEFVPYLLAEDDEISMTDATMRGEESSLQQQRYKFEVWPALLSNGGFVLFMLLFGSWYVSRKDF